MSCWFDSEEGWVESCTEYGGRQEEEHEHEDAGLPLDLYLSGRDA